MRPRHVRAEVGQTHALVWRDGRIFDLASAQWIDLDNADSCTFEVQPAEGSPTNVNGLQSTDPNTWAAKHIFAVAGVYTVTPYVAVGDDVGVGRRVIVTVV